MGPYEDYIRYELLNPCENDAHKKPRRIVKVRDTAGNEKYALTGTTNSNTVIQEQSLTQLLGGPL